MLVETGILDYKPIDTSIELNHHQGLFTDQLPTHTKRYQMLVGRLNYLSHTRPKIAYVVSVVSQLMLSPSEAYIGAVIRILKYLKMAPDGGLISPKCSFECRRYTIVDWVSSIIDHRSTSGYFNFVGGNLVTLRSKKHKWLLDQLQKLSFVVCFIVYMSYCG